MSRNPALLQEVLEDWLRLPKRQELFAGLGGGVGIMGIRKMHTYKNFGTNQPKTKIVQLGTKAEQ